MRKLQMFATLALIVLVAACGGTPTGPIVEPPIGGNTNQGVSPRVLDGITREPVMTGTFMANGSAVPVVNGQASTQVLPGTLVEITGTGTFLDRVATMPSDGIFLLWPTRTTSIEYITALVYWNQRLMRPTQDVRVVPADEIAGDQAAMDNIRDAIQAINEALDPVSAGSRIRYSLESGSATCTIRLDSENTLGTSLGRTSYTTVSGNAIVATSVLIKDISVARTNVVHHELGHTLGLGHSISTDDLMHTGRVGGRRLRFASTELVTIQMMFNRKPGNSAPDRE